MIVDAVVHDLERAWNTSDPAGWAAVFAPDAVFVDVLGRIQHGRTVIERECRTILDTIYLGSTLALRHADSRALGDGVVLVHTTSTLTVPDGPRAGATESVQTMVVENGLVTAFQNTIVTDLAAFAREDPALAAREPSGWRRQERRGG